MMTNVSTDSLLEENQSLKRILIQALTRNIEAEHIGRVFHDFNNILSSSMGYSSLAIERAEHLGDDKLTRYLGNIEKAGIRSRDLVRDRLDMRKRSRDSLRCQLDGAVSCVSDRIQMNSSSEAPLFIAMDEEALAVALKALVGCYEGVAEGANFQALSLEDDACQYRDYELKGKQIEVTFFLGSALRKPRDDESHLSFILAQYLINSHGGHLCESLAQDKQFVVYLRSID